MSYLQHGRRHGKGGSDPIQGLYNDWVTCQGSLGTVASGADATLDMAGTIAYQTDDGSVYAEVPGVIVSIGMLEIGSYLVRAKATFPEGKTGYAQVDAVIGGPCTTYDWDNNERYKAASLPDSTGGTDFGKYGGEVRWAQACVVHDLSAPTGAYIHFQNLTTVSLIGVVGHLQILRLT